MTDRIKQIAAQVRDHKPKPKVERRSRMLSLSEPQFTTFQKYCKSRGITTSEVIDSLISAFMAEIDDGPATPSALPISGEKAS